MNRSKDANRSGSYIEDEPMPNEMRERRDSLNDPSDEEEEVEPFWNAYDETRDDELIYLEALQDELKSLQVG